ncbi:MAG: MerR family transcriptional regulator, partial [Lachnospiraceae bacterium]|nr:MerR family transcriptional regulator [Lachnospiraceae bacterium]
MAELFKIREVSSKYDISARALRYYEDVGLINSIRSEDYAYRMYDKQAIKQLEQILILRKQNISIKDISLIFQTNSFEVILDVLGKKVEHIDGEVALLQDLKDIILEFVEQIKNADFSRDIDVKRLYERAEKVESRITNIRIIQINPFKAFSSGADTIENVMGVFQEWQEEHNHLVRKMIYGAPDFLWFEEDMKAVWIWAVEDWVTE